MVDNSRVVIAGKEYVLYRKYETFGTEYPQAQEIWELSAMPDNKSAGTLIFLGEGFGYRFVMKGDHAQMTPIDYTPDKIVFL